MQGLKLRGDLLKKWFWGTLCSSCARGMHGDKRECTGLGVRVKGSVFWGKASALRVGHLWLKIWGSMRLSWTSEVGSAVAQKLYK